MGRYFWIRPEVRRGIAVRLWGGESASALAVEFGCHRRTVWRIGVEQARVRGRVGRCAGRLSFSERERILVGVVAGESDSEIARALGRDRSTVGREIKRSCASRGRYRPLTAEWRSWERARRPKPRKLAGSERLLAAVEAGLLKDWSPAQIAVVLRREHPDDPLMRISHETIYQSLYVQSRGELRRELSAHLRTGRTRRRVRGQRPRGARIAGMVMISERPAEVEDRAVPGHWEGDLLIGASNSQIATLVERHTRYVMLARLGYKRTTLHVIEALKQRIETLPVELVRSLTWDQGVELAAHQQFLIDTGVQVYFCDPHSPWQRGSNENTNGLLRQYLPRKLDLAARSQLELDQIAAKLNSRPRKTLDWSTPAEKMQQLLLQ